MYYVIVLLGNLCSQWNQFVSYIVSSHGCSRKALPRNVFDTLLRLAYKIEIFRGIFQWYTLR